MTERVVWEAGSSACVDGQGLEIISIPSLIRVVVHSSRCPLGPKLVGGSTPEAYVPERGGLVGASRQGLPSRFHALLLLLRLGLFRRGRWPRPFGGGCNAAPAHRVRGQTAHLMRGVAAVCGFQRATPREGTTTHLLLSQPSQRRSALRVNAHLEETVTVCR